MKNIGLIIFFMIAFISFGSKSNARIKVSYGEKEILEKVIDLSNNPEYSLDESGKNFVAIGRLFSEYTIMGIPIYVTKEARLVGISNDGKTYYDIPEKEMEKILQENKIDQNKILKLSFFTRVGGKLIALVIISLMIYGILPNRKKKITPTVV